MLDGMPPWQVFRIDEIDPIAVAGVNWHPVRRTLGVEAFGVNAYSANTGEQVVEEHTEMSLQHEEIYVVLRGGARFTVGDEQIDAPAGTIVHLADASVRRGATATMDGTTVLAVGAPRGEAYTPSAWEAYFGVERHRATGDTAAAIAELEEARLAHPTSAGVLYSLGCWYALAGDDERALGLVREATELDGRYAEWARSDADLASIHDRL